MQKLHRLLQVTWLPRPALSIFQIQFFYVVRYLQKPLYYLNSKITPYILTRLAYFFKYLQDEKEKEKFYSISQRILKDIYGNNLKRLKNLPQIGTFFNLLNFILLFSRCQSQHGQHPQLYPHSSPLLRELALQPWHAEAALFHLGGQGCGHFLPFQFPFFQ